MKTKGIRWRLWLAFVSLLPVIRRARAQDTRVISSYEDITFTIWVVSGLISFTMLALTFVLAGRFRFIENAFGGLDKMYIVHAVVGSWAFVFMLLHPIFLVLKYLPDNFYLAASYLLPGAHRSINFWIAGFITIILLMVLTLYIKKMKYHHRKNSHTFFSLAFLFVAIHVFMIEWDLATTYFPGYYPFSGIIMLMWLGSYAYTILWRRYHKNKIFSYQVSAINLHGNAATEIAITPLGKAIDYQAGQFAFLRFESAELSKEAHPFSFASWGKTKHTIKIIMKHSGDFTKDLHTLRVGDEVQLEGPYGKFTLNTASSRKKIWIAWGIGITPFMAMADELITHHDQQRVDLYYLVRSADDLIWLNHLEQIAKKIASFHVIPRVSTQQWRLRIEDLQNMSGDLTSCEYYMCGPTAMKVYFQQALHHVWVPSNRFYSEWYNFKI